MDKEMKECIENSETEAEVEACIGEKIMFCGEGKTIARYDIGRGGGGTFCELEDGRYGISFSLPDPDKELKLAILGEDMEKEARDIWNREIGGLIMEDLEIAEGRLKIRSSEEDLIAEMEK